MNIVVALGAILDGDNVLIARRHNKSRQGGYLELPGGKLENGENIYKTLLREIKEETSITVLHALPLIEFVWHYPDYSVHFHVFEVDSWVSDTIDDRWYWVEIDKLVDADFPPANRCIINALKLPQQYLITPQIESDMNTFLDCFRYSIDQGIRLAVFRDYQLDDKQYCNVLKELKPIVTSKQVQLLSCNRLSALDICDLDGIHLNSQNLMQCSQRPVDKNIWFSASCHNKEELEHALQIEVDFVTLSPVLNTSSHPDISGIGWQQFFHLNANLPIPIYALGGLNSSDCQISREYGAQGIAGIHGLWRC